MVPVAARQIKALLGCLGYRGEGCGSYEVCGPGVVAPMQVTGSVLGMSGRDADGRKKADP